VEYNHANQTNALRVALDDLHNTSASIFMPWNRNYC
jgi:hypothetical protein